MAKQNPGKPKPKPTSNPRQGGKSRANPIAEFFLSKATRETVESVAIAFILAFLFRTFEAEAFVIPTGSMAHTLMGKHKDVVCPQCGYQFQAGESEESIPSKGGKVIGATCPICRHLMKIDPERSDHPSFTGDRILVSKFIYDFHPPQRWDVVVFKNPHDAKQNYIKRLVGKGGETVKIRHGDIHIQHPGKDKFQIARKPPYKLKALIQAVYDTHHIPKALAGQINWPARWQEASAGAAEQLWTHIDSENRNIIQRSFLIKAAADNRVSWLRYRHLVPSSGDWQQILEQGERPADLDQRQGQLILDFYAYNAKIHGKDPEIDLPRLRELGDARLLGVSGFHWVGDLVVECEVTVQSEEGLLLLDLVEAGTHYQCRIDLADGKATLSITAADGSALPLVSDDGKQMADVATARTVVRGPGDYRLRFSNVDDQLVLWVNEQVVLFEGPTTYLSTNNPRPYWSEDDPGDLAPVAVGSQGASLRVSRLRVLRDIYYIAEQERNSSPRPYFSNHLLDYDKFTYEDDRGYREPEYHGPERIREILLNPRLWRQTDLFDARREVVYHLEDHHFLPLGDNSPESSDARIWGPNHYVDRKYLIGKALLIYWPHTLHKPIPYFPNFWQMGLVR